MLKQCNVNADETHAYTRSLLFPAFKTSVLNIAFQIMTPMQILMMCTEKAKILSISVQKIMNRVWKAYSYIGIPDNANNS